MGLLSSVWKGVTGPLRGIGYLAQGKVRKAVGAFGDTGELAAPILGATGVGAPLAAGVGAVSGAASKWGRGESNLGKIAMGAAGGAALGAGGAEARTLFAGGIPGVAGTASTAENVIAKGAPGGIVNGVSDLGGAATSAVTRPSVMSGIGKFAMKHPEVLTGIASTGANMYGAQQEGQAMDRSLDLRQTEDAANEADRKRRFGLDQMNTLFQGYASMRPRY